mmetsp:Transcript_50960/g.157731  ORF Transcript_50960/g.157731 Transcript_50960/m.157731 type:complete len:249 (+) Transcript_50960:135-881(+)
MIAHAQALGEACLIELPHDVLIRPWLADLDTEQLRHALVLVLGDTDHPLQALDLLLGLLRLQVPKARLPVPDRAVLPDEEALLRGAVRAIVPPPLPGRALAGPHPRPALNTEHGGRRWLVHDVAGIEAEGGHAGTFPRESAAALPQGAGGRECRAGDGGPEAAAVLAGCSRRAGNRGHGPRRGPLSCCCRGHDEEGRRAQPWAAGAAQQRHRGHEAADKRQAQAGGVATAGTTRGGARRHGPPDGQAL